MSSNAAPPSNGMDDALERRRIAQLRELAVLDTAAEPLFDALSQVAALVTGAPIALVSLVDVDRQWFKANVGLPEATQTPREVAFCAHTIQSDELLEVADATADERFANNPLVVGKPDIRFYAGAPIVLRSGLRMGSLCVIDRIPRELSETQRAILRQLAAAVANALEQRALAQERASALSRLAETERLRAVENERFEQTIEATNAAIWEWRIPTGEIQCNERWAGMLGYALEEIEPLSIATLERFAHPDDWVDVRMQIGAHLAGRSPLFDAHVRLRHRNGEWIWVATRGRVSAWADDGSPLTMYGSNLDITARKEAERRLVSSEALLDRTGQLAGVGGWEVDLINNEITWTDETCRIHDVPLGYRPTMDEAFAFYEPEAREPLRRAVENAIAQRSEWDLELPFRTAKGRSLWVRAFGTVEIEGGEPRWLVGALQDVTIRKRAVLALESSERRFRKLFEFGLGLICIHDMDGVLLAVNPAAAQSLGYVISEMMGQRLSEFIPSAYRSQFDTYLARIGEAGIDTGMLLLRAKDGAVRTWQYRNVLDDDSGQRYVLGHAQDVTERERAERALKERSIRDPLTGCFNRAFLDDLAAAGGVDQRWGVVAIDLVKFKLVNDTHGHQRGDEVLVEMGHFLQAQVSDTDAVVRVGGDEFIVLLRGERAGEASSVRDRLMAEAGAAPIGFTAGVSSGACGASLDAVWTEADRDLYRRRADRRELSRGA